MHECDTGSVTFGPFHYECKMSMTGSQVIANAPVIDNQVYGPITPQVT